MNPLVFMAPNQGKPLFLYISAIMIATLVALFAQQDHEGKEQSFYYISCTLVGYEKVITLQLRMHVWLQFFLHKNCVITCSQIKTKLIARIDPLKYLLNKATLIGRLVKWIIMLSEFKIDYVDSKPIKAKVIVDQLIDAQMIDDSPLVS